MVLGDAFEIEEVLTNYLSNALNHLKDPKKIVIRTEKAGDKCRVSVFNTGDPIPEDELDKVGTLLQRLAAAGVDALIVQDPAVLVLARERGLNLHMHASTQCSIREPERARPFGILHERNRRYGH